MMYSKTTSSANRSKKCSPSTSPATPSSMIRKNGSRAWKSSRLLTAVIGPRPRPRLRACAARGRRNLSAPCRSSSPLSPRMTVYRRPATRCRDCRDPNTWPSSSRRPPHRRYSTRPPRRSHNVLPGGLDQACGVTVRGRGVGVPGDDRLHAELLDLVHRLDPVHPLRVIGVVHPAVDAVVDDVAGKKRVEVRDVDSGRIGHIALSELEHVERMALNLELPLVERDRHRRLLEQLVREEAVPDLHPLGRRLLGKQRHDLRQRDGARLRELVENGVSPKKWSPCAWVM